MNEILKTTLLGLFFGTFGTTLGGILGIVIKKNSNKFLSFLCNIQGITAIKRLYTYKLFLVFLHCYHLLLNECIV